MRFPAVLAVLLAATAWLPTSHAQCEVETLLPQGGANPGLFGSAVAVDGNRMVVSRGSLYSPAPGAVHVMERIGGAWVEVQELTAVDSPGMPWSFGSSVDIDGDRIVVGRFLENSVEVAAGSVYVFEFVGGTWVQTAKLLPSTAVQNAAFGWRVDLDGNTVAVSAPNWINQDRRGHVYVFEHGVGGWQQAANLRDVGGPLTDLFGRGMALSGDTLIVGAPYWTISPLIHRGQVIVYEESGGAWIERQRIPTPDNSQNYQYFGSAISLQGDRAVITAPQDDNVTGPNMGMGYIFERNPGGDFILDAQVVPAVEPSTWYQMGNSVALDGDHILLGSNGDAAFLFERDAMGQWDWRSTLRSDEAGTYVNFAWNVTLAGGLAYIGEWNSFAAGAPSSVAIFSLPVLGRTYCTCPASPHCPDVHSGCANSTGQGAELRACGTASVAADDLRLDVWQLTPNQAGVLVMGSGQGQVVFGDGHLCVSPGAAGLFRFPPAPTGTWGNASYGPGIVAQAASLGAVLQPGDTWNFQFWYRDILEAGCQGGLMPFPAGYNLSDAVELTFVP